MIKWEEKTENGIGDILGKWLAEEQAGGGIFLFVLCFIYLDLFTFLLFPRLSRFQW